MHANSACRQCAADCCCVICMQADKEMEAASLEGDLNKVLLKLFHKAAKKMELAKAMDIVQQFSGPSWASWFDKAQRLAISLRLQLSFDSALLPNVSSCKTPLAACSRDTFSLCFAFYSPIQSGKNCTKPFTPLSPRHTGSHVT